MLGKVTVNLTYTPILASRPKSHRICPGVRLTTTLIIRHIVSYIWTDFEISLTNQINFIVLTFFTIYLERWLLIWPTPPSYPSRPRSLRICPGVRMRTTLIIRHIVSYIWTGFGISLTNQNNLIVLMCFIIYKKVDCQSDLQSHISL